MIDEQTLALGLEFDGNLAEGVGRVQELENILSDLIDLWDENYVLPNALNTQGDQDRVNEIYEQAGAILAGEEEEEF